MADAIEAVGATAFSLPPYSPDLNPIEQVFSLIFQAIIYVFQHFVLKRDQSVLRFPPVPTSIVRGFDRGDLDADGRTGKFATKNPAHSASRKDLGRNYEH